MVAVSSKDWDIFTAELRSLSDAVGEHCTDKTVFFEQADYNKYADQILSCFQQKIAPKLPEALAQEIFDHIEAIRHHQIGDLPFSTREPLGQIKQIFQKLGELSGRYESYEDGLLRRRTISMDRTYHKNIATLFDHHANAKLAFFLDLDGSLVHAEPGRNMGYQADERLQYVLNRLNVQTQSALSILTGRPEVFMQQIFPNGQFFSATEHGVFGRDTVGGEVVRAHSGELDFAKLRNTIMTEMMRRGLNVKECFLEQEKQGSLTVQFTNASDPAAAALHIAEILQLFMFSPRNASLADPLMLVDGNVPGNRVMELVPSTADKGRTIEWFYQEFPNIFEGKTPVMFGDSGGDETAMQEVLKRGGFAVGVGAKAPAISTIKLRDVDHARELLTDLAEVRLNQDYAKDHSMQPRRFVM